MKKIILLIAIATASVISLSLQAQTADDIVGKYIDAIGGKEKVSQVNSLYMEGSMQIMGNENPATITILNGKGYKSESEFNGQKSVQCYTDKGGWSINPMAGGGAQPMPDELYKANKDQIYIASGLFDYATKGNTVELLGKDGSDYKLKLINKDKVETTFFIDASTYYITKAVKKGNMMGQDVDITIKFSDYKKTDFGYVIPFTVNLDLGQFQLAIIYKKAEVNKTIDPAVFNMPK